MVDSNNKGNSGEGNDRGGEVRMAESATEGETKLIYSILCGSARMQDS